MKKCQKVTRITYSDDLNRSKYEALNEIANGSVDLIFVDPPYNIGKNFNGHKDKWEKDSDYLKWCYEWIDLCIKKLTPTGSFYVMTSTQFMPYFDIFIREKMDILSRVVWFYDSSGVQAKKYYGSMYEPILFCAKDKNNYTFNTHDILVDAKTGSKRKLIDYRKTHRKFIIQRRPLGMCGNSLGLGIAWMNMRNIQRKNL